MSTAKFDTLQNAAGSVSVPVNTVVNGSAKAWVNFNGTTSPGTIRASFNVSSVTKNSTGNYTVNFTTAMPDANYSALSDSWAAAAGTVATQAVISQVAGSCQLQTGGGSSLVDSSLVSVAIFR
jgi:hypothetical protein